MTEILERRAAITGIGQSEIGRRLNRDPLELTLDRWFRSLLMLRVRSRCSGPCRRPNSVLKMCCCRLL